MFEMKTLTEALDHLGHLDNRDFMLVIWTDTTKDCKPVSRVIRLVFPRGLNDTIARDIILGINSKAWILAIIDDHRNVFRILDAEAYAKRGCEENVEKEKGKERAKKDNN